MTNLKKTTLVSIALILLGGIIYWNFRIDIKDYFISKNVIYWSENVKINYSDFEAKIDNDSDSDMFYYHAFYLKANDVKTAYVRSFFDKTKSWAKDSTYYDFEMENRLQKIRFDLYEVYARKYNAEINIIRDWSSTEYSDLTDIGERLHKEINVVLDEIFDSKLSNEEKINLWRPKIDRMLEENPK